MAPIFGGGATFDLGLTRVETTTVPDRWVWVLGTRFFEEEPMPLHSTLFSRRRRTTHGGRKRDGRSTGARPGFEGLERRAMLAADDILVSLVGNRVRLTLDPAGASITNLATTYDAPAARLTITAATAGTLTMGSPVPGISIDAVANTITVNLNKLATFAGLSIVGGSATDSIRIGPGGVNLAAIGRGAAAQGLTIDTGTGVGDSITITGPIAATTAPNATTAICVGWSSAANSDTSDCTVPMTGCRACRSEFAIGSSALPISVNRNPT